MKRDREEEQQDGGQQQAADDEASAGVKRARNDADDVADEAKPNASATDAIKPESQNASQKPREDTAQQQEPPNQQQQQQQQQEQAAAKDAQDVSPGPGPDNGGGEAADAADTAADAAKDAGGGGGGGEDDAVVLPRSTSRAAVKKGTECPYLDTISRQNLDFDFEKCCSVSLSPVNVYVCLVCGKYFQGRGLSTHAYTHALESAHHMFMKLDNGNVYCLPDNYEVLDKSLDDIRHVRDPRFRREEIAGLDKSIKWARALDGTEYMPGLVGLNNMKANDYINVIMQICARITPLRDFFLDPSNTSSCRSPLVYRFGELLRKMWNTRNFKGQVSPHEFVQAVRNASKKRFSAETQSDPVEFWSWLLNHLHLDLTGGKPKKPSIITQCLQGELEVTTLAGTGKGTRAASSTTDVTERLPFLLLGLELPPAPLFKDVLEKNIIPQVPIFHIMRKFDGESVSDDIRAGRRRFRITRLPRYLALHYRRFTKNNFFVEKNPTLVNFPVKGLELRDILPLPEHPAAAAGAAAGAPDSAAYDTSSKYDLVANLVHDGKADSGTYRVHTHRKVEDIWYEVQDLAVQDILPQMVALSEAYFQVFELRTDATAGSVAATAAAATATAAAAAAEAAEAAGRDAQAAEAAAAATTEAATEAMDTAAA
ncbi:hypothetical protein PLESTB_001794200 [Pleodorina starrii]|uniref:Uncharacterized protein n=1 Tax=Pleodorina starrii TaxID=330485 RepID=A0A9W6BZY9_9CHLO|nr:hypothetical protein PLESTM_001158500 [Pleodorina starrii]GLC61706.1 hypothetical protein PLESTB_001794200 [Pleodorina starrii]GLC69185.1 hypothetical protein PLESTF_000799800 [Pleodorina starrii]